MVLSIEAKQVALGKWEAYTDNAGSGRVSTSAVGAGGVKWGPAKSLTSVDREGTRKGFDIDLIRQVSRCRVQVPVIASGEAWAVSSIF